MYIAEQFVEYRMYMEHQYPYRDKRSCVTSLLEVMEYIYITSLLDEDGYVDILYFILNQHLIMSRMKDY